LLQVAAEEMEPVLSRRLFAHVSSNLPGQAFSRTRTALLRRAGVRIGARSLIQGAMHITGDANPCDKISIGTFTLVSGNLHCDVGAPIRIGDRVRIGHDVSLLTVDHHIGPEEMRAGERKYGPIEIDDGAWLASRVVVLPGVRIGAGAIVAAGSVVTRDVPANSLVVGVPARVVRDLNADALDELQQENDSPVSSRRFLRQA
jgi:acetyltransferase-like isoleucine patch superfamily enzyme